MPEIATDAALWLGLLLTPGLGQRGYQRLVEAWKSPERIYAASLTELEGCQLTAAAAQHIHDGRSAALGAQEAERAAAVGAAIVTVAERTYPELLREIFDPPQVLYVKGSVAALDGFGIAAVGTRRPTTYGQVMAERLGEGLAQWGLTVISGMARGIDSMAQNGCLKAGGRTVAVLGTGVDIVYPAENARLTEALLQQGGALVSEFPLGTPPLAQNFPLRNRVISGMALGVLVVEGGEYSGSRITARMALEQNRDVFAVPGMATQKQAWLPNMLIRQGAKLVTEVADIVDELPSAVRAHLVPPAFPPATVATPEAEAGSALVQAILDALRVDEASHVDEIVNRLDNKLSAPELLALLFELELGGRIRQLPGKKYLRVS